MLTEEQITAIKTAITMFEQRAALGDHSHSRRLQELLAASAPTLGGSHESAGTKPIGVGTAVALPLTDEQIVRAGYMHTVETDEPLFQFDRQELIAMVRELLAAQGE